MGSCLVCFIKVVAFIFVLPLFLIRVLVGLCCNGCGFLRVKEHEFPKHLWNEFNHKYIQLSGVSLHYVDAGLQDAPLILFIHGFPELWYCWRHQIRHFSQKYRVIAIDQRGYGHSGKPDGIANYKMEHLTRDIKELINALGYEKAVVVGHDWGGAVAWNVATEYPEVVDRLICMDCPHPKAYQDAIESGWAQRRRGWYIMCFQLPWLPEWMCRFNDIAVIDTCFKGMVNKENFTDDDREAWKSIFMRTKDFTGPINYYRAILVDGMQEIISTKIQAPTLVIWGEEEAYIVREAAEGCLNYTENGRVQYIPQASHWVQQDQPQAVNDAMEQFLAQPF